MWKFISLSCMEYKALVKTIDEFTADVDQLRRLQDTGHYPLILASRKELMYNVTLAPKTLEVLCEIDHRFVDYKGGARATTFDVSIIDSHQLLLGHKESYKKHVLKSIAQTSQLN